MISFIMMAKNEEKYLRMAVEPLLEADETEWELIIVDDHSSDRTYEIAMSLSQHDARIRVVQNPDTGVVKGTNYAFTLARGNIIKCIDSDDVLLRGFFDFANMHAKHDVLFHSISIVDEGLRPITTYHPNLKWLNGDFKLVAESLTSYPKVAWSFNREIAEKVFPMPDDLPFEDVWMALLLKKHAKSPGYARDSFYLYRQHSSQTFRGILNYSRAAIRFRANWLLKLMDVLELQPRIMDGPNPIDFTMTRIENRILIGEIGILKALNSSFSTKRKIRLIIQAYVPFMLKPLAIAQWSRAGRKRSQ